MLQSVEFKGALLDEYHGQAVALPKSAKFARNPLNKGAVDNPLITRKLVLDCRSASEHSLSASASLFNDFCDNFAFLGSGTD